MTCTSEYMTDGEICGDAFDDVLIMCPECAMRVMRERVVCKEETHVSVFDPRIEPL